MHSPSTFCKQWFSTVTSSWDHKPLHKFIIKYSLGNRILCVVCLYELHLKKCWGCVRLYDRFIQWVNHESREYNTPLLWLLHQPGKNNTVWNSYSSSHLPAYCSCLPWVQWIVWTARQLASQTGSAIHRCSSFCFVFILLACKNHWNRRLWEFPSQGELFFIFIIYMR